MEDATLTDAEYEMTAEGIGFRSRFGHKMIDGMDWPD